MTVRKGTPGSAVDAPALFAAHDAAAFAAA